MEKMMMGYYGNTWVAMLKLIPKVPLCVNWEHLKNGTQKCKWKCSRPI